MVYRPLVHLGWAALEVQSTQSEFSFSLSAERAESENKLLLGYHRNADVLHILTNRDRQYPAGAD
jgi:hypothetical protein